MFKLYSTSLMDKLDVYTKTHETKVQSVLYISEGHVRCNTNTHETKVQIVLNIIEGQVRCNTNAHETKV